MTVTFKTTLHYPAHQPDTAQLDAMGADGWIYVGSIITPPASQWSVDGLMIFWCRHSAATRAEMASYKPPAPAIDWKADILGLLKFLSIVGFWSAILVILLRLMLTGHV